VKRGDATGRPSLPARLDDPTTERAVRELRERVDALADLRAASLRVIAGVELEDGVETPIAHGLGRPPVMAWWSFPRDPATVGMVEEVRSDDEDRSQVIVLKASGYGATITLDVAVL
jgi:hypothetical protein